MLIKAGRWRRAGRVLKLFSVAVCSRFISIRGCFGSPVEIWDGARPWFFLIDGGDLGRRETSEDSLETFRGGIFPR